MCFASSHPGNLSGGLLAGAQPERPCVVRPPIMKGMPEHMVRFDPDKAVFAALAARVASPPEASQFSYVNNAAVLQFGDALVGQRVLALLALILGSDARAEHAFALLMAHRSLTVEGNLNGRDVQYHSVIDLERRHLQAAIVDITKSRYAQEGFEYTVCALARASEVNDEDTGQHNLRIARYAATLAELSGSSQGFVTALELLAQLHDVGKIHVSPEVIRKPGRLSNSEYQLIQYHTIYGARIIGDHARLKVAHDIALGHHEKWDGSGYPHQRQGEEIPLAARIVTIVDVFDALVSARPYKPAFNYREALAILRYGDERITPSRHFDPALHEVFLTHYDRFTEIHQVLSMSPTPLV
jgi:HD-GYP domain-containing protein (c-di-GMP phosphodiesterase class II)